MNKYLIQAIIAETMAASPPPGQIDAMLLCASLDQKKVLKIEQDSSYSEDGKKYIQLLQLGNVTHAEVIEKVSKYIDSDRCADGIYFNLSGDTWVYAIVLDIKQRSIVKHTLSMDVKDFFDDAVGPNIVPASYVALQMLKKAGGFEFIGIPLEQVPVSIAEYGGEIAVGHMQVQGTNPAEARLDAVVYFTIRVNGDWRVKVIDESGTCVRLPQMNGVKHSKAVEKLSENGVKREVAWFDTTMPGEVPKPVRVYVVNARGFFTVEEGERDILADDIWKWAKEDPCKISETTRVFLGQIGFGKVLITVNANDFYHDRYSKACSISVEKLSLLAPGQFASYTSLYVLDRFLRALD